MSFVVKQIASFPVDHQRTTFLKNLGKVTVDADTFVGVINAYETGNHLKDGITVIMTLIDTIQSSMVVRAVEAMGKKGVVGHAMKDIVEMMVKKLPENSLSDSDLDRILTCFTVGHQKADVTQFLMSKRNSTETTPTEPEPNHSEKLNYFLNKYGATKKHQVNFQGFGKREIDLPVNAYSTNFSEIDGKICIENEVYFDSQLVIGKEPSPYWPNNPNSEIAKKYQGQMTKLTMVNTNDDFNNWYAIPVPEHDHKKVGNKIYIENELYYDHDLEQKQWEESSKQDYYYWPELKAQVRIQRESTPEAIVESGSSESSESESSESSESSETSEIEVEIETPKDEYSEILDWLNSDEMKTFSKFADCFEYIESWKDLFELTQDQLGTLGIDGRAIPPLYNLIQARKERVKIKHISDNKVDGTSQLKIKKATTDVEVSDNFKGNVTVKNIANNEVTNGGQIIIEESHVSCKVPEGFKMPDFTNVTISAASNIQCDGGTIIMGHVSAGIFG